MQLEKNLQNIIEENMEVFLGVKFLATEYSTGKVHNGRIDSLGIDENNCPVIIEYKRSINENVINQGLYYLDWLLDHKAEFKFLVMNKLGIDENNCPVIIEYKRSINENVINQGLYYLDWLLDHKAEFKFLVMNKLGAEIYENIEWTSPRLICIANDFTKYDIHAVKQINRNIDLIKYKNYKEELLLLEMVHTTSPRLICIANDFTKYDIHAVKQINRNIDLIKYKNYKEELLLLEMVHTNIISDDSNKHNIVVEGTSKQQNKYKTVNEFLEDANENLKNRYYMVRDYFKSW